MLEVYKVFNDTLSLMLSKYIADWLWEKREPEFGEHKWPAKVLIPTSGTYFCHLRIGEFKEVKKSNHYR
jgi:hypothetical protein